MECLPPFTPKRWPIFHTPARVQTFGSRLHRRRRRVVIRLFSDSLFMKERSNKSRIQYKSSRVLPITYFWPRGLNWITGGHSNKIQIKLPNSYKRIRISLEFHFRTFRLMIHRQLRWHNEQSLSFAKNIRKGKEIFIPSRFTTNYWRRNEWLLFRETALEPGRLFSSTLRKAISIIIRPFKNVPFPMITTEWWWFLLVFHSVQFTWCGITYHILFPVVHKMQWPHTVTR